MNNPCYKCEDRKEGCHSTCEKYIAWQKYKRTVKAEKLCDIQINGYEINRSHTIDRYKRMKGHKK